MLVFKSYLKQANGKILGNISPNSGNYEYLKNNFSIAMMYFIKRIKIKVFKSTTKKLPLKVTVEGGIE